MKKSNLILFLILFLSLQSCGKKVESTNNNSSSIPELEESMDGANISGLYLAKFETLNPHINGTLPGSLTLKRSGDRLLTFLRLFAGNIRVKHRQAIYPGRRCPSMSDDQNLDGFIDIQEARSVVGKILIPLDGNLNSQYSGRTYFPRGDLSGNYHYEKLSSFSLLLKDLREKDDDPDDLFLKLDENEPFGFDGRVVLIEGVSTEILLPESVAGDGDLSNIETFPIACGVIKKNETQPPGTIYNGEVPGPIGTVDENQDTPADGPIRFPGRRIEPPPTEEDEETEGGEETN